MKIMATGGRDWTDEGIIREALTEADGSFDNVTLLHGCASGADAIAAAVALELGWIPLAFPADWEGPCVPACKPGHRRFRRGSAVSYCPDAGKRRNQEMIDQRPDLVIAFPMPKSRGTYDAVNRARAARIPVRVVYAR